MTLSAGMNWTVPITFRPVAKERYDDVIEFNTSFGKFYVPVKATLPEHVLEFPQSIDFILCPIRETAKKTFLLKNVGELSSHFEWATSKPFAISPKSGFLEPESHVAVTVDFKPENASVFDAVAVCTFGDKTQWEKSKVTQAMTIHGIGKYSQLKIEGDQLEFDFGEVYVGKTAERKFVLQNPSAVHANFKIRQSETDPDPYFEFSTLSGTVPSGKSMEITIAYTPVAAELHSIEYFDIATVSGNVIRITCSGKGIGPKVSLSTTVVNFNDSPAGTTVTRAMYIVNNAATPAFYQFLSEPNSIFRIDKPWGTINPQSSVALTIRFSPTEPLNYWRRVYCLVEHQDALFVDFLGTCYNDKRRPATFHPRHIENYQKRKRNGLWSYGPEQLEDMMKAGAVKCENGELSFVDPEQAASAATVSPSDSPYDAGRIASEYFYDNTGDSEAVTLMDTYVDFGSCSRPRMDNSFYGAQLECFVYFKSMRNFRLVNEDTFTPPWCLTPMVAGNTFPPGEDTFLPKINFGALRLDFPSCHVDKTVYRTVRVSNTGATPVKFAFMDSAAAIGGPGSIGGGTMLASRGGPPFAVKPRVGLLHKNESRLIVFRFSPGEQRLYEQALNCVFNSSAGNTLDLQMRGVGYYPQLSFADQNALSFRPICVEAIAQRRFEVRNASRIAVNYAWQIPNHYASIVSIEPTQGTLAPNSTTHLTCTFAPNAPKSWTLRIPCYYSHEQKVVDAKSSESDVLPDFNERRTTLLVAGRGTHGKIVTDPDTIDLGPVLVNTIVERDMVVYNPCECDVFYSLQVARKRKRKDVEAEEKEREDDGEEALPNNVKNAGLEIAQISRVLPARSQQTLRIRLCLTEQVLHEFKIYYQLKECAGNGTTQTRPLSRLITAKGQESHHLCDIKALGVHPLIQVQDIRCEGLSKTFLWQLFSLNRFNAVLKEVNPRPNTHPPDQDDSFPTDMGPISTEQASEPTLTTVDFDFGSTPVGCKPSVYHFSFTNSGVVCVDWVFLFPNDLEVEIEHWADPGDYTDEQLHHNLILDNNIFTISPKSGRLDSGESAHIVMTYSHEFAGQHHLPVIFKLRNGSSHLGGKEILINFNGYSVPPGKKCLHLQSSQHTFKPVPIGTDEASVQTYRLMNCGSVSLQYYVDLAPLERIRSENKDVEIFQCRTSSGVIGPGETQYLEWVFRPLEAKDYEVDVPISVVDGKTRMVTFRGSGVNQVNDPMPDSQKSEETIPSIQVITMPRQIAWLSMERVDFGHVPWRCSLRQLVIVRNVAKDADLSFTWIVPDYWPGSTIQVVPATGRLKPGQSRVCKIVFTPQADARAYDMDIVCEIRNETELGVYNVHKEAIEAARREGRLLTAGDIPAGSLEKLSGPRSSTSGSQPDLNKVKYRTLPPISPPITPNAGSSRVGSGGKERRSEGSDKSRALSAQSHVDEVMPLDLPPAPEPFRLFVAILACTHPPDAYRLHFPQSEIFFHQIASDNKDVIIPHQVYSDTTLRATVTSALSSILDEVMQDPDVQELQNVIRGEPLPYFAQISSIKRNGIILEGALDDGIHGNASPEQDGKEMDALAKSQSVAKWEEVHGTTGFAVHEDEGEEDAMNLLSSTSFQNLVETVLEGTIYNIMQEADMGEFELTRRHISIVQ
ncbi:hypothetical protein HK097_009215 [Rhizophlyctis rosea]|uniref:Uncharacterized protein n=1 Tax=Rhizophlyctis rosea TaxID=64517 RepID=A0AAD5SAT6_9FUNG|nr:hypothetical protein HK097_009215 [Rhizophlyctis rosea]